MNPSKKRERNNGPSGMPPRIPTDTKKRTFINTSRLPNSINILQRQLIRFENKLNETKELYENIDRIFQEPNLSLQQNQHVIHFHRVEKPKIEASFQRMILSLEHSKTVLQKTISHRMINGLLTKTVKLLNQSDLDKIFEYLENLQIQIVEPYERYKIEQRSRIERTFRSPYPEIARQRERKEQRHLLKIGYPRELVEHGIVELSPSVRNNQLLSSHLKRHPNKPNLLSQPSSEYPPHFAVKELFPKESLYLYNNNEEPFVVPPMAAIPPVAPLAPLAAPLVEENLDVPTQPSTPESQGGGKRKKEKKRSSKKV